MKRCIGCNKIIDQCINYCSWECSIKVAQKEGGRELRPNGLPITVIRHDGLMLECEHGDHPDYKFPVTVENLNAHDQYEPTHELHALIYIDDDIAQTLYECCHWFWQISDGSLIRGPKWFDKNNCHKLDKNSLRKIQELKHDGNKN